jgi:hypothetical protein
MLSPISRVGGASREIGGENVLPLFLFRAALLRGGAGGRGARARTSLSYPFKRNLNMSENNIIIVNPALFASVTIDKDDLMSVQVARVETKLIQDQHETESVLRELKKKLLAAESDLNKAVDAVKDDFDISALTRAMESLGFTNEINIGAAVRAKQLRSLEKEKNRLSKLLDKIDRKIKLEERDLEICRKWRDTFDEVIATGYSCRPIARTYISKLREKYGTTLVPYRSQK